MEYVTGLVLSFRNSAFMKNNAVFWMASLGVAFINYLYYPILGRLMRPTYFGETQTIISIFTQAAIFFQVLGLVGIGIITKYKNESDRTQITNELSRIALIFSVVLLLLTIIFVQQLKNFFHFTSISPFFALSLALLVSVPLAFANSYLQGHKKFWTLSIGNMIGATAKILFAVLFVLVGLKAFGAVGGLVCAQLLALIYALKMGKGIRHFIAANLHFRKLEIGLIKPELPFAGMVLITAFTTNLLLSFDILVVKHYFPPREAGFYTGISIIANIVFYVTGPFAGVMLPSIKPTQNRKVNYKLLQHSLGLVLLVGGLVTLTFILAPDAVVTLLLGHKFISYAVYLKGLSFALFLYSLANLLIYFHIGLRNFLVAPVVAAGLVITLWLLKNYHTTMSMVVRDLVQGSIILLLLMIVLSIFHQFQKEVA